MRAELGEAGDTRSRTVVIVGGGPAGLACGRQLARLGWKPLVVERVRDLPPQKIGESLAPSAVSLLQQLDLGDLLAEPQHLNSPGLCSSWGHTGLAYQDFLFHPHGHGWHLDRVRFEQELRGRALEAGCAMVYACVQRIERTSRGWLVRLDDSLEPIRAAFVVDATGRASAVSKMLGVRKLRDDLLVAWYAYLSPTSAPSADATALVESQPDGWFYLAMLPNRKMVAAFMTDPDLLPPQEQRTAAHWLRKLETTTEVLRRVRDAGYRLEGTTRIVAADSAILQAVAGDGWAACGDAAASYDPLSSHGIATALATGRDLAGAIVDADGGSCDALWAYADLVRRSFDRYRELRARFYQQETRWLESAFWKRRQEAVCYQVPSRTS